MSASFKNEKKKFNQNDLRRLMNEHKGKQSKNVKKIESPLAKYNEAGQLTCILCKSVVRSEAVWTVHVNAKQHKDNIALAKQLKEKTKNFTKVPSAETSFKRPGSPINTGDNKKLKGILKNNPESKIPSDFFDNANVKTEKPIKVETDKNNESNNNDGQNMEVENAESEDPLPEGFFDDPIMDAKARNQEYKDPIEEEWERFQKEMKEQNTLSAAIIAEDQEEATTERQIEEIDEQIRNWSRVLDLERKKELIARNASKTKQEESDSDLDIEETDEFLDWRAKKSYI